MPFPTAFASKLISDIRASYWFIPAALVLFAIALSLGMSWIDQNTWVLPVSLPEYMLDTQIEGARSVLSVIASAVIGVAGVMFSVTIVAVSFASGKYGPRLIGNFMRDRGNQWSMGLLISTFVYALIVLREVQGRTGDADVFVPQYSLWLAIALALVSVATMIYFVHHIPETINVSRITESLGKKLCAAVVTPDLAPDTSYSASNDRSASAGGYTDIPAQAPGYVQRVDVSGLARIAEDLGVKVTLKRAPGAFVAQGDVVVRVAQSALPAKIHTEIESALALGSGPTEAQNAAFIAHQLVEMVARALSPGVNDPFTAINCLNWLYTALAAKAQANTDDIPQHDLLELPDSGFSVLLQASFGDAVSYIKTDPLALAHFKDLLGRLKGHCAGADSAAVTRLINSL